MRNLHILFFLLLVVFSCTEKTVEYKIKPYSEIITSDLEATLKDSIITSGKIKLSGASQRSNDYSRSGQYSVYTDSLHHKVLMFHIDSVKKGDAHIFSVWQKLGGANGALTIQGKGSEGKLWNQAGHFVKEENGWGLLQMHFIADKNYDQITVFVFSNQAEKNYFDDFKIESYYNNSLPSSENALNITIPESAMDSLSMFRDSALVRGIITGDLKPYFTASLTVKGDIIPIKLRFKGDWTDHLKTDKWSYRIKIKGDHSYLGLKSFSIQHPSTRSFMSEWFIHRLFEKEGLLTTKYVFIPVIINGENKGVYALEEHFDKQLLERNHRREGPIVKFDESGLWEKRVVEKREKTYFDLPILFSAPIDVFKGNRTFKSPSLHKSYIVAMDRMKKFRMNEESPGSYMDVNSFAKFMALSDALGGVHSMIWHNQRMYLNPITNKLEPIAYDEFTAQDESSAINKTTAILWMENINHSLIAPLLNHSDFRSLYFKWLEYYSSEKFLQQQFADLQDEIEQNEALLNPEYPFYHLKQEDFLDQIRSTREQLKTVETFIKNNPNFQVEKRFNNDLLPKNILLPKTALRVNTKSRDSLQTVLQLSNFHSHDITVVGYQVDNVFYPLSRKITLKSYDNFNVDRDEITLPYKPKRIVYTAKNCGDSLFYTKISKWPFPEKISQKSADFSSIQTQVVDQTIKVLAGNYKVNADVTFPENLVVEIEKGTVFNITNGASITFNSSTTLDGTKGQPIKFISSDRSGSVLILPNNGNVQMNHVHTNGLNTINRSDQTLTGAFTIYEGKVVITNCIFSNNHCEDGLNLIRCTFEMNNSIVENAPSDGFDADFCTGKVENSVFKSAGNDGVDFSGSEIDLINCTINNVVDKGISGGEGSTLSIENCTVNGANIAIASKDKSHLTVNNLTIKKANYAFAAFMKKPEYGPSEIIVNSIVENRAKENFLIDKGSVINMKGKKYESELRLDIDSLYFAFQK